MWRFIKREEVELSEEDREKYELVNWALESHFWIELKKGYYACKYCGVSRTSEMGISVDTKPNLCLGNPVIKSILDNAKIVYT